MSETSQPIQVLDVFNKQNFHTGVGSEFVKFPKAQSTVTMPNGVKFGDGSFQNSASTGSSLTIQDASPGTDSVSNVSLITVTDGILTAGAAGEAILSITGSGATPTLDEVLTASSNVTTETITIDETTGTFGSSSGGTITLRHDNANGANSIVFKNSVASANYAAINYIDNIDDQTTTYPEFTEYTILQNSNANQTNASVLSITSDNNANQSSGVGGDSIVIRPCANLILDTGASVLSGSGTLQRGTDSLIIANPTGNTAGTFIIGKQARTTTASKLEVSGDSRFEGDVIATGEIQGATLTDGSATLTGGAFTGLTSVTSTTVNGNLTGNVTGDVTGDIYSSTNNTKILENGTDGTDATFTGDVTGEIKTSTATESASFNGTDTLTLTTAGNTYETFDYSNSGGAVTITTLSFGGTQRNNSQYVVSIDNSSGTGAFSFSTTFSGAKINYTTQVDIPSGEFGILTIYYKNSTNIFASASVFS